jgi:multicomponent Na+:H+ antiporter subunit D
MNAAVLPFLLPLFTGTLTLFLGKPGTARRGFLVASALVQLGVAAWLIAENLAGRPHVLLAGGWASAVGITLVADLLAAIMVALSSLTALAAVLFTCFESRPRLEHPLRLPLVQFMVAGINLAFLTGDLFNLFVAFEIMLIASYALLTLEADDWDIKQAYPYLAINLVGSTLFICAAGLAYGLFGTLNFAGIITRAADMSGDPRILVLALLLLVVFGTKAGLFPLYYWLPNSYPILPAALAGLYSGMLTKVGVYVLLRMFATVLPHDLSGVHQLIAWLAGLTMVLAVMGALSRNFIRGILSFHILSQIGFMALAIGLFTPLSIAACIFYVIHHIIVKASLFLVGGVATVLNRTDDLDRMGHLWRGTPWVGIVFLCQGLSLAGIPPLSGFWGKYLIIVEGLRAGEYILIGASLVASVLTLLSMLKIWLAAFWSEPEGVALRVDDWRWRPLLGVVGGLTVLSLGIGFGAEAVMQVALRAAQAALDQPGYVELVLGAGGKGGG